MIQKSKPRAHSQAPAPDAQGHPQQEQDRIEQYLRDIGHYARLSESQERKLIEQIRNGSQEAREQLIAAHLRLVVHLAKRHKGRSVDLEDLVQEGNLGLIKAVERFDATKQCRFGTYAAWWMEEHMMAAIAIRTKEPDMLSLDNKELGLAESLEDSNQLPEEGAQLRQLNAYLYATFSCLTQRERHVLMLRYGLDGRDQPRTQEQVAKMLGITNQRVSVLEEQAIKKIRKSGSSEALRDYWQERTA